jgi:predicted nucleic acid-binding protein
MSVRAKVIDITHDKPRSSDVFLVDTNVLYWLTYVNASYARNYQIKEYPQYINHAISISAKLCCTSLTLVELAHQIEKHERDIYCDQKCVTMNEKEFRYQSTARSKVIENVMLAWKQVLDMTELVETKLDESATLEMLNRIIRYPISAHDSLMLQAAHQNNITTVLTDDADYIYVPNITVFTANSRAIGAARRDNRLVKR